jgi:hypothetical protein
MDKSTINTIVENFIKTSKAKKDMLTVWMSDDNQSLLDFEPTTITVKQRKVTKSHKSAYLFFCDSERERLRELDPPVVKRNEVHTIMSAGWKDLKEAGGDEYTKFVEMSERYSSVVDEPVKYEITKPFHKFSVAKRKELELEFTDDNAITITNRLSNLWVKLSRDQKSEWSI